VFVEAGAKEVIKTVLDKTILAKLSESINKEISERIESKLNHEIQNNQLVRNLLSIDNSLRRNTYQTEIEAIATRILSSETNKFCSAIVSIAKGIMNKLTDGVSGKAIRIFTAGKCLVDLMTFLQEFVDEFKSKLNNLKDKLKIDYLLHNNDPNVINSKTAREITTHLKAKQYIADDNIRILKPLHTSVLELHEHKQYENYVIEICNNVYNETNQKLEYQFQKSMIVKTLTD
jgi:hypothetical protein